MLSTLRLTTGRRENTVTTFSHIIVTVMVDAISLAIGSTPAYFIIKWLNGGK